MIRSSFVAAVLAVAFLAGCGSGDINIEPSTSVTDNSTTNNPPSGGNENDVCAFYTNGAGQKIQGTPDGDNCVYSPSFVDAGNRLDTDLTIPALPNGGAHIFQGSLFVGETYRDDAEMAAAGITKGGDGPTLTIEAGAILAFESNTQFVQINRGSQIFAVGTPDAPIVFTSVSDINGTVGPEDVQQWGGIVINGFGVTNQCSYTGSVAGGDLATSECHVDAEGSAGLDESQYGGDNNDDSSGRMEYVIVKHTGATVGNGDELNGISFGAVGRNTIMKNIEMYSVFDDGIELFGGAVNIDNYVAVYARDDSIDMDEGYSGTITNALVVQSATDGNHCIEADGIGNFDELDSATIESIIAQGINSRPTVRNLTCIISPNGADTATHDPGAGWRLREGIFATITDSMIISSFGEDSTDDNYCLRVDNRSQQAAQDGDLEISSSIFACQDRTHGGSLPNGTSVEQWAIDSGNQFATISAQTDPTAANDADLQLLEGTPPLYSIDFSAMQVDGAAPTATAPAGAFIGGLSLGDTDWTQPWAYGLQADNEGEALWFE
ncbi:MAG TPA: hypothetical protein VE175_14265 [Woeseiaceae bacterium]|nr:hypothetical protein [Woeseiaceae bacterium]